MIQAAMRPDRLFWLLLYLLVVFAVGFVAACLESSVKQEEGDDPR